MSKIESTRQLGEAIRTARKSQKLTQRQLAAVCGVGERFIRELEQGKASCHLAKAIEVVSMLGLSLHLDGGDT